MVDSNRQQMASYVDLIKNVAASLDGFSETNLGEDQARHWLIDTFPGSFEIQGGADADTAPEDKAEADASALRCVSISIRAAQPTMRVEASSA
ncbi:hypothetical protein [Tunturiibacter gelidiferens]|uniref:hypothetical protein n=1 Tax=Tunturiibacter gelidiferens TaxID=3069689 RepID=UPI003D9B2053